MSHPTLAERVVLIESELNVALKYEKDDLQVSLVHLERAKNELQKAEHDVWHKFHTEQLRHHTPPYRVGEAT